MKKLITTLAIASAALVANTNDVQAQAWNGTGDTKLSIGLNGYGYGTGVVGTFDYGIAEYVSLGLGGQFYFSPKTENQNLFLFGRVNLHLNPLLNLPSKLDIYPGLDLGLYHKNFGWGAHLGFRYMFTPKLGLFAEVGSHGSLGLTFNL